MGSEAMGLARIGLTHLWNKLIQLDGFEEFSFFTIPTMVMNLTMSYFCVSLTYVEKYGYIKDYSTSVLQNQGLSENIYEAIIFSEILLENLQYKLCRLSNVNSTD